MPAGEIQFGDGTLLEVNDGASNAYAAVTELGTLNPPGSEIKVVERKRLANTGIVERVPSPRVDPGEVAYTYEITDVAHARLDGLKGLRKHAGGAAVAWRVTYPDGLRLAFNGFVRQNKPQQLQAEEIAMCDGAIVVTSLIAVSDTIT